MRRIPAKRQEPPPQPAAPRVAAASAHLSPAMPGQATDAGKVSFCDAKEEIRAELEGLAFCDRQERPGAREQRLNIVWRNVVLMSLLHLGAVYSLVLIPKAMPLTLLWGKCRRRHLRSRLSGGAPPGARGRCSATNGAKLPGSPLAFPTCPGPLGIQFCTLSDGQVFLPGHFQLLLPPAVSLKKSVCWPPYGEPEGPSPAVQGERREWLGTGSRSQDSG